MNWLPRASLFDEAEAARLKRKAQAEEDLASTSALASGLMDASTSTTGDSINLTLQIAATRIQETAKQKQEALAASTDLTV